MTHCRTHPKKKSCAGKSLKPRRARSLLEPPGPMVTRVCSNTCDDGKICQQKKNRKKWREQPPENHKSVTPRCPQVQRSPASGATRSATENMTGCLGALAMIPPISSLGSTARSSAHTCENIACEGLSASFHRQVRVRLKFTVEDDFLFDSMVRIP